MLYVVWMYPRVYVEFQCWNVAVRDSKRTLKKLIIDKPRSVRATGVLDTIQRQATADDEQQAGRRLEASYKILIYAKIATSTVARAYPKLCIY